MQWRNAANAGFSPAGVETWLPVNPNYAQGLNVEDQQQDPDSLLNFYRRQLSTRKQTPALMAGEYEPLHEDAEDYLAFTRYIPGGQDCMVSMKLLEKALALNLDVTGRPAKLVFSSRAQRPSAGDLTCLALDPFEILIAEL
jgi:alpha-glucosidase